MRRSIANQPATALRSALASPWSSLRVAATRLVRRAIRDNATLLEAAASLGIDERTLRRIRAEFPGVDGSGKRDG